MVIEKSRSKYCCKQVKRAYFPNHLHTCHKQKKALLNWAKQRIIPSTILIGDGEGPVSNPKIPKIYLPIREVLAYQKIELNLRLKYGGFEPMGRCAES